MSAEITSSEFNDSKSLLTELEPSLNTKQEEASKEVINILLLGQTGMGKSTFINALVNYVKFSTLEEAIQGGLECLIPTSYTVMDPSTLEEIQVQFGNCYEDDSENQTAGASATQYCRCYQFPLPHVTCRIIDTPGVGDTRGLEFDKANFNDILSFIGQFHYLHGICILLKPNESRLTEGFKYCIKELFSHLDKSCAQNICFVFTNARTTFYQPGETIKLLKVLLGEIKAVPPHVLVPLKGDNSFYVDSEAFRFLVLNHKCMQSDENLDLYSTSWNKSVHVFTKLLEYITNLDPYPVIEMLSLNSARQLILDLSQPMGEILKNVQSNVILLEEKVAELQTQDKSIEDLAKSLYIPLVEVETVEYSYPQTVCASAKCRKVSSGSNIKQYYYPQICHDKCTMPFVRRETTSSWYLRWCQSMKGGKCTKCGCPYQEHKRTYYQLKEVQKVVLNETIQKQLQTAEQVKDVTAQFVSELEQQCQSLKEEITTILSIAAKFALFLEGNAITTSEDPFQKYLEKLSKDREGIDAQSLKWAQDFLQSYMKEKSRLQSELLMDDAIHKYKLSIEEIGALKRQLYSLKFAGPKIQQIQIAQQNCKEREHYGSRFRVYEGPIKNAIISSSLWLAGKAKQFSDYALKKRDGDNRPALAPRPQVTKP